MKKKSQTYLLKKVLGIVLAVLCLAGLIYAGVRLYYWAQGEQELNNAKKNIVYIKDAMSFAKEKPGEEFSADIYGPTDWWIIAWPYNNMYEKPNKCKGYKFCICFCDSAYLVTQATSGGNFQAALNKCDYNSVCEKYNNQIKINDLRKVPNYISPTGLPTSEVINLLIQYPNFLIKIEKPPMGLKVRYTETGGYEIIIRD